MVGFALSSGITIGMISPFVKVLFTPRPAVSGGEHPGSVIAAGPGAGAAEKVVPGVAALDAALGPAPPAAGRTYLPGSRLAARVDAWKQDLRTGLHQFC